MNKYATSIPYFTFITHSSVTRIQTNDYRDILVEISTVSLQTQTVYTLETFVKLAPGGWVFTKELFARTQPVTDS